MMPRLLLFAWMLLPSCIPPGSITAPAGARTRTVEIATVEASSPDGTEPASAVAYDDAQRLSARTAGDPVEPAVSPPLPGTTDKYAGSVGLGFASSSQADVRSSCMLNGKQLWGKVQVVDAFADIKVQVVDAFADIKVQKVDAFADSCGKWQFVTAFPDLKVQFVTAFPDLKIKYVDAFPGNN